GAEPVGAGRRRAVALPLAVREPGAAEARGPGPGNAPEARAGPPPQLERRDRRALMRVHRDELLAIRGPRAQQGAGDNEGGYAHRPYGCGPSHAAAVRRPRGA